MKEISIYLIRLYRKYISPILVAMLGNACRFTPTCSEYTIEALNKYGFKKGMLLGIMRVSRCHPFGKPGWDPVK